MPTSSSSVMNEVSRDISSINVLEGVLAANNLYQCIWEGIKHSFILIIV